MEIDHAFCSALGLGDFSGCCLEASASGSLLDFLLRFLVVVHVIFIMEVLCIIEVRKRWVVL